MRTGSLYRGIGKLRESRRTVQQHTNTPRPAEEIKYGTAKMGNTTSTGRGIYFFEDQVTIAERQRVLMAKIHPKITVRNPIQRRQLKMNIPQNTSLECSDVVLSRCADVWHRLFTVAQPPQCAEKSELPRIKPRFIFHIRGDFGNPSHNSPISDVLVTKAIAAASSVEPFQDRKVFVHLFEPGDLVQDFASHLQGPVHDGMLHRVGIYFDEETTDSLKAFASFWLRTRHWV